MKRTYKLRCKDCQTEWSVTLDMSMCDRGESPTCPECDSVEWEVVDDGLKEIIL